MKEDFKYTEKFILDRLEGYYNGIVDYHFRNIFFFGGSNLKHYTHWESDFLFIRSNGYINEVEVKISRGDYFCDFKHKPKKHEVLSGKEVLVKQSRIEVVGGRKQYFEEEVTVKLEHIPNNFYYAVPQGLISLDEVPEYAGLIEVNKYQINIVKKAPFLHKNKLRYTEELFNKCYHKWKAAENELWRLNNKI